MVIQYLEKTRKKYIEQRSVLMEKEKELHLKVKENLERKEEQKTLTEQLNAVRNQLYNLNADIDEIDSVIKVERERIEAEIVNSREIDANSKDKIRILQIQETERQRIARELHDTTVQSLTSLVHKSELCKKLISMDPERAEKELGSMSKIIRYVIEDARGMIYNLRPMSFDDIGFNITVERFLDKLKICSAVKYEFKVEGDPYDITPVVGITLLRVIQEACCNSVKHGKASNIRVVLKYAADFLTLKIEDDGTGFQMSSLSDFPRENNSGFGLSMMKERVYLMSGELKIHSAVGKGCKIVVKVSDCKE